MKQFRITGLVLIAVPVLFNVVFFALGSAFEYPDILREPTAYILEQFNAGGASLVNLWYAFSVTALLAIPMALLFQTVFAEEHPQLAHTSAIIGVISGLVQAMGLFRWVFIVPDLASSYVDPASTAATRDAIEVVFHSFHQYAGVAIGEHLGYIFTGSWTILISVMMFKSTVFRPWMGIIGLVGAAGIMFGLLEPAGVEAAGAVNAISYVVWSLWLIASGVILLRAKQPVTA